MRSLSLGAAAVFVAGCGACTREAPEEIPGGDSAVADAVPDTRPQPSDARPDTRTSADGDVGLGWSAVPNGALCGLYEADLSTVTFPKHVWSPCGSGCQMADGALPGFSSPMRVASGGSYGGDSFLQLEYDDISGSIEHTILITRNMEERVVAAIREYNVTGCAHGRATAAPLAVAFLGQEADGSEAVLFGRAPISSKSVLWQQNWLFGGGASAMFDWSGGAGLTFADSTVRTVSSLDAGDWTLTDPVRSYVAAGHEDTAFWSTSSPTGDVIRGFGASGVVATFVQQDADDHAFAVSDDKLVWFGAHGPSVSEGTYDAVEVYWSPRPESPSDVVMHKGPSIPYRHGLLEVETGGDYVATTVSNDTGPTFVLVVQLSTGKTWAIPPRPSSAWLRVMSVSPTEIVVAEIDPAATGVAAIEIQRLLRFDVSQLDAISTAW